MVAENLMKVAAAAAEVLSSNPAGKWDFFHHPLSAKNQDKFFAGERL